MTATLLHSRRDFAKAPTVQRFTIAGSDELENHLRQLCQRIPDSVRARVPEDELEAVLLGGGYGRGEGGVFKNGAGDQLYNDLDFYIFVRGNRWLNERRFGDVLHALAGNLSSAAGVVVEFQLASLSQLRRSPVSMFSYDLVMGHRQLCGAAPALAGCEHHRRADQIPLAEATRLLMNRCSGLLFAQARLAREQLTEEDIDFVLRNHAKAELALGDAVLTAHGQYHWSCRERHQRLLQLASDENLRWLADVRSHHEAGVQFKLQPWWVSLSRRSFQDAQMELASLALTVWCWLESRRLHCRFGSARDYALSACDLSPETHGWRNRLINTRAFGPAALFKSRAVRHPRERLLRALALLLWEPAPLDDPGLLRRVQDELRTNATTFAELVEAYRALWLQFR